MPMMTRDSADSPWRTFALAAWVGLTALNVGAAGPLAVVATTRFTVENDYYRLEIDTSRGGSIRSFVYKPFDSNAEWIYPAGGGLLQDMIWQQQHPGELQDHPYEHKVLEQGADGFRIELWRAFQRAPYAGLMMRKQITLLHDSPAIRVRMTLENPTDQDMFPGAWLQNRFFGGGHKGVPVSYRPSYMGIRMSYYENGRGMGDEFVRRPTAGWAATFDRETGAGFVGLVDYNYLQQQYSCLPAYTMEFFFDRVLIRAGQSWSTDYMLVPVTGMKNCFYADKRVYVAAGQEGDQVTFTVHATDRAVAKTAVTIVAEASDRSARLGEASAVFEAISPSRPARLAMTIPGVATQPAIVRIGVEAEGQSGVQEFLYAADPAFYHLQESAVTYRAEPPRKVKPELMGDRNLQLERRPGLQVFYAFGLWHELNRVKEALAIIDSGATLDESVLRVGTLGPELSRQPLLAEELLGYDLVVLNNVGANALGEAGEVAVEQYVRAGGALLVCGGVHSLGKSRWHESPLADVLPLTTQPFWDLERLPAFTPLDGGSGAVQWLQTPKAMKPGARVEMAVGGRPLLVTGQHGKGRVAVWLGTPMGQPPDSVTPYWDHAGWRAAMKDVLAGMLPSL